QVIDLSQLFGYGRQRLRPGGIRGCIGRSRFNEADVAGDRLIQQSELNSRLGSRLSSSIDSRRGASSALARGRNLVSGLVQLLNAGYQLIYVDLAENLSIEYNFDSF